MDTLSYKTISANKATVQKEWVVIDATDMVLGRMGSRLPNFCAGNTNQFHSHVDCGDNVIIINADKVILTGNKWTERFYYRHSGYPGGQRKSTPAELMAKDPERFIKRVIKGMLPKNRLGAKILGNLYVFAGPDHDKQAQKPKKIDLNALK